MRVPALVVAAFGTLAMVLAAMGCSGGTGPQDAVVCQAGIDALGK